MPHHSILHIRSLNREQVPAIQNIMLLTIGHKIPSFLPLFRPFWASCKIACYGAGAHGNQPAGEAVALGVPGLQPLLYLGELPAEEVPGSVPPSKRYRGCILHLLVLWTFPTSHLRTCI